jgi:HEAT repeat protein
MARGDWVRIAVGEGEFEPAVAPAAAPGPPAAPPAFRWRHAGLDELLARSAPRQPDLYAMLKDADPTVAANAAIALGRTGQQRAAGALTAAIRSAALRVPTRCAAVEALAVCGGPEVVETLRQLTDQFGDFAPGGAASYQPDVHAELVRALARHIDPADDPRLAAALQSPAVQVRIEALTAWAAGHHGAVPSEAVNLRSDGDPRVRAAAMAVIAARRVRDARQYLTDALRDSDFRVRVTAIAGLGGLDDGRARATVAELLQDRSDLMRAEAVTALARNGARTSVLGALGDASWRVRLRVARALAAYPDREGSAAVARLLDDPSAEVERQVVASLAAWPIQRSGPLLLEAMRKPAMTTRKAAAEQLVLRWPAAMEFSFDAAPQRREEVLGRLQEQFRVQFGLVDRQVLSDPAVRQASAAAAASPATATSPAQAADPATVARVEQLLRAQDAKGLAEFGPGLVEALEQLAVERQQVLPESVYHDILPRGSAVFAALDQFRSSDVAQRRAAAEQLAAAAQKQPLGPLAVARLGDLAATEADDVVWRSVLEAVAGCAGEPAVRLAYVAIGHGSAEVRRRACEYLAQHPAAAHANFLNPALADGSRAVVLAAVRALGAADHLDDAQPLRKLLACADEQVQLETAAALAHFRDPAAVPALERLTYSDDPKIRGRVALAMGELGDASFAAPLVRLLDDHHGTVSHAALASLPKVAGSDVARQVLGDSPAGTAEQIRRWKQWYAGQQGGPLGRADPASGNPPSTRG